MFVLAPPSFRIPRSYRAPSPLSLMEAGLSLYMHLISFINFAELELLDDGYTMTDQLASTVKTYLALLKIQYVSPFACIGVVPDNWKDNSSHPLNAFGDTRLILRQSVAEELRLSCESDIQNTSANGLALWKRVHKLPSNPSIIDLCEVHDKLEYIQRLASAWTNQSYPEVRLYRGLRWSDIDDECAERLKSKSLDIDSILGPNIR